MVKCYHSSQTCWDCRWSPIQGSNKSKKVPWKYGMIKFSEKMFRWYIPEMKVRLKRVLVLLAISLNWFVMVQKRWKILSRATPKAGFEKNVVQIQIPSRTGLDARLQHLISTLCLIKKKRRPEMKKLVLNLNSWLMTILTIQWKHQRKNNISHYYGTNCKIWSQNPVGNDSIYPWK